MPQKWPFKPDLAHFAQTLWFLWITRLPPLHSLWTILPKFSFYFSSITELALANCKKEEEEPTGVRWYKAEVLLQIRTEVVSNLFNEKLVHIFMYFFSFFEICVTVPEVKVLGQRKNIYKNLYVYISTLHRLFIQRIYIYFKVLIILNCSPKGHIIMISPHSYLTGFSQAFSFLAV